MYQDKRPHSPLQLRLGRFALPTWPLPTPDTQISIPGWLIPEDGAAGLLLDPLTFVLL